MKPFAFAAAAMALAPVTALAQAGPEPEESALDGDYLILGAGVVYGPSYDGSDDQVVSPIPLVQGRFKGITISPRRGGVGLDLIPDGEDARFGVSLGPVVNYSANRARRIKDPVVKAAGKLDEAIEIGATGGVSAYKLLNPYDTLSFSADVSWDIAGAHKGMIWSPGITYITPVSRAAIVTLNLSARHVDDDYARYYYSVTPAQSAASGLPEFDAKGGWDSWNVSALAGYDLNGNLLDGGFALVGLASYGRMLNDAKETPYTSIRGSADQWMVAGGVSYTF
ncbi:structural protein MipA [Novosphingobium sp. PC22D]|uniref:MipA/OmpV family protein n=1 Tax=Novosphingobium sp. PC22D TaxID=1962403 RepID=UPI000BEFA2FF|nr:MipA/OmpV family protein [Novosphingobium sp. PC22D]PEQ14421.1 structural protein MipA [Novosphingobium sp. PC22D]